MLRAESASLREGSALLDPRAREWARRRLRRLGSGPQRAGADRRDAVHAVCDAAALWRGALIVSGHVGCLDGEPTLAVVGPTGRYAGSLVAAASRLQVEVRTVPTPAGAVVVVVTSGTAVGRVLRAAGAPGFVDRVTGPVIPEVVRLAAPRGRRPQRAASVARARADVHRLAELDEPVPVELAAAASVRLDHPHATMTQLAVIAGLKPHVLAGRLRRLHVLAEHLQAYPRVARPSTPARVAGRPPTRSEPPRHDGVGVGVGVGVDRVVTRRTGR